MDNCQFSNNIRAASVACKHAPSLLLDSGPGRPSIPPNVWAGLLPYLRPWMVAGGKGVARHLRLHMRNPASPTQLVRIQDLPWLHALRLQHAHSAIYSRHLLAIAALTQLQELELVMEMPKLELRSLAHQRLRRVPLDGDVLTSLVNLSRLEISCKAYTGTSVLLSESVCVCKSMCWVAESVTDIMQLKCSTPPDLAASLNGQLVSQPTCEHNVAGNVYIHGLAVAAAAIVIAAHR